MDIKAFIVNAVRWLLSKLFPPRRLRFKAKHLPEVMGYQYRLSRAVGTEPCRGFIQAARVVRVFEKEAAQ